MFTGFGAGRNHTGTIDKLAEIGSPFKDFGKHDTGGVAFLVAKSLVWGVLSEPGLILANMFEVLVPGRVARVTIPLLDSGSFAYTNVHNFAFTNADMLKCEKSKKSDINAATETPHKFGF